MSHNSTGLLEYKEIRRSMNASCGRRLTEATFTCVRGFPYGRLCASRMDDPAETQVDQPRQRHGRQRRQCREPAMSPTSVMIAICFAPKERERPFWCDPSPGWCCYLAARLLRKPSVIPFPYRVLWRDQSDRERRNPRILPALHARGGRRSHRREARRQRGRSDCRQITWVAFGTAIDPIVRYWLWTGCNSFVPICRCRFAISGLSVS